MSNNPHNSQDSGSFSSMLELRCFQVLTLSHVYSIVLSCILLFPDLCLSPTLILCLIPVLPIHVYITLLCSLSHSHILQLLAMSSESIRLLFMYVFDLLKYQ